MARDERSGCPVPIPPRSSSHNLSQKRNEDNGQKSEKTASTHFPDAEAKAAGETKAETARSSVEGREASEHDGSGSSSPILGDSSGPWRGAEAQMQEACAAPSDHANDDDKGEGIGSDGSDNEPEAKRRLRLRLRNAARWAKPIYNRAPEPLKAEIVYENGAVCLVHKTKICRHRLDSQLLP